MILQYMVGNKEVYQDSDAISVAKIKLDDNGKTLNDVLALIEEDVYKRQPIDKDGKPQKTTPFTGAVGILLHDVYASRPQGTILKKAYINHKRVTAHAGITYDAKLVAALVNAGCRIVIEDAAVAGTIPDAASTGGA